MGWPPVSTNADARDNPSAVRIPSLDGLRAVSVMAVMVYHIANNALDAPHWVRRFIQWTDAGPFGVRVFFTISGFLITSILARELALQGRISLSRFYVRRTFRIVPPYFAYLALLGIASALGLVPLGKGDALHAWTFTMNLHVLVAKYTYAHAWSLSVEEQFYLCWPLLLGVSAMFGARVLLATAFLAVQTWHFLEYFGAVPHFESMRYAFFGVVDWIAAGALLALEGEQLRTSRWYARCVQHPLYPVVLVAAIAVGWTGFGYWRRSAVTVGLAVLGIALLLEWAARFPRHVFARPLNWAWVTWIGRLSYSLYLWQQPFLYGNASRWWERLPLNVLLVFLFAAGSYYFIEQPALTLRTRLEPRVLGAIARFRSHPS